DGMVHAICESNGANPPADCGNGTVVPGTESWAFVPPALMTKLDALSQQHAFMVDGSFSTSDICLNNCTNATNWKTVMLGSLRQGGKKFFALDVTDVNNPKYMFALNNGTLGETWSPPTVVRVKVAGTETWVAVAGGGVDNVVGRGNSVMLLDLAT